MTDQPNCEARIASHMEGRAEDFETMFAIMNGDSEPTDDFDEESLYGYGLCVDRKTVLKWHLSTGGPGDWLEIEIDPEDHNAVQDVSYHFNDWFDHAERRVPEGSPLWRAAEWIAEIS